MSKSKYAPEFRAMVAQEYIDGAGSTYELAEKYHVGKTTLQKWVALFREQGIKAFITQEGNKSYTKEFKITCVEMVLSGIGSSVEIAAQNNIHPTVLESWIKLYNANRELKDYCPKREVYMAEARRKTTIEERKEIVEYCIEHGLDYKGTASIYDVSYSQVYSWVKKYNCDSVDGLTDKRGRHKKDDEVDELERLRRENIRLKRQLEISRAAYYKWLHREVPEQELENINLAELIKEYDERFKHILGYRRMTSWINHFNHTNYSKKRVHRIMKKLGIHSVIRKKNKKYASSAPETVAENRLGRNFYATTPNEKWVTDVTEFKIPGENKKLYLSAILDLYDRYPVAYIISTRNNNRLVFRTFDKALAANPKAKPLFHSDRGFQYTSKVFQRKLTEHEIEQSMSRVGHCIDNGPTEGFWGIIKSEMYQMYEITDEESLRNAIHNYIRFYSEERPQDRYHCKTPLEVRREALSAEHPAEYKIPRNKRIEKYKEKWCA